MIREIMDVLEGIEYGFLDSNGRNIIKYDEDKWEKEFYLFYHLQSPSELLESKCGVCWDQVELERELFSKTNYIFKTYFIYIKDNDMLPSHTFLVYEDNSKYYWFEHSWGQYKGIHEYSSLDSLFRDVAFQFTESHPEVSSSCELFLYQYDKPKYNIDCEAFYEFIETQKRTEINN